MMRAIVGSAGVYVMTKGVVAVRFLGLFFSAQYEEKRQKPVVLFQPRLVRQSLSSLVRHM